MGIITFNLCRAFYKMRYFVYLLFLDLPLKNRFSSLQFLSSILAHLFLPTRFKTSPKFLFALCPTGLLKCQTGFRFSGACVIFVKEPWKHICLAKWPWPLQIWWSYSVGNCSLLSQTNFLTFRDLFAHGICHLCHTASENSSRIHALYASKY